MRARVVLFAGTMAAFAQNVRPAAPLEIRGTVVEGAAKAPIASAEITISALEAYRLKEVRKSTRSMTA